MTVTALLSESTLRRRADRAGYSLKKNRSRSPDHPSYGGYQLVCHERGFVECGYGPFGYSADLQEIAEFLRD